MQFSLSNLKYRLILLSSLAISLLFQKSQVCIYCTVHAQSTLHDYPLYNFPESVEIVTQPTHEIPNSLFISIVVFIILSSTFV